MGDSLIESVDVSVYTVPTDAPEADGTLSWDSTTMILVQVRAGGTSGTGWTYGAPACATMITDRLAGIVRGRDALDVGGAFEAMVRAVRNDGRPGAVGYAISAVDVALWDLKARLLNLPLPRLLGAVRGEVPVYGSGGFTSYDDCQLRDQLSGWALEQRIPRVKIKVGQSWGAAAGRDLERMAQARDVIGAETELFVDANGGYGRKQAIRVMSAAADLDVRWLEEPVSSDDLDGLREVRDAVPGGRDRGRIRPRPVLLPPDVRRRRGGLPAGRRFPLRRNHRVVARRRRRRVLRAGDLWPLRAAPARCRGHRGAEPAASGMVPRPRSHRVNVLRRHPGPSRGRCQAQPGRARAGPYVANLRRGTVPNRVISSLWFAGAPPSCGVCCVTTG